MQNKVTECIKEVLCLDHNLETTDQLEDLGADSLDIMNVALELEDAFDIDIDTTHIEQIKTVGDLIDIVKSKVQ